MTNEEAIHILLSWRTTGARKQATDVAIAALRSPGAGAMREALIDFGVRVLRENWTCVDQEDEEEVAAITEQDRELVEMVIDTHGGLRALPLPALEVPKAVIEWSRIADNGGSDYERYAADMALRQYFHDAYGVKP